MAAGRRSTRAACLTASSSLGTVRRCVSARRQGQAKEAKEKERRWRERERERERERAMSARGTSRPIGGPIGGLIGRPMGELIGYSGRCAAQEPPWKRERGREREREKTVVLVVTSSLSFFRRFVSSRLFSSAAAAVAQRANAQQQERESRKEKRMFSRAGPAPTPLSLSPCLLLPLCRLREPAAGGLRRGREQLRAVLCGRGKRRRVVRGQRRLRRTGLGEVETHGLGRNGQLRSAPQAAVVFFFASPAATGLQRCLCTFPSASPSLLLCPCLCLSASLL